MNEVPPNAGDGSSRDVHDYRVLNAQLAQEQSLPVLVNNKLEKSETCCVEDCGAIGDRMQACNIQHGLCSDHMQAPAILVAGEPMRWCSSGHHFKSLDDFEGDDKNHTCANCKAGEVELEAPKDSTAVGGDAASDAVLPLPPSRGYAFFTTLDDGRLHCDICGEISEFTIYEMLDNGTPDAHVFKHERCGPDLRASSSSGKSIDTTTIAGSTSSEPPPLDHPLAGFSAGFDRLLRSNMVTAAGYSDAQHDAASP
jgi:hypothetical protein